MHHGDGAHEVRMRFAIKLPVNLGELSREPVADLPRAHGIGIEHRARRFNRLVRLAPLVRLARAEEDHIGVVGHVGKKMQQALFLLVRAALLPFRCPRLLTVRCRPLLLAKKRTVLHEHDMLGHEERHRFQEADERVGVHVGRGFFQSVPQPLARGKEALQDRRLRLLDIVMLLAREQVDMLRLSLAERRHERPVLQRLTPSVKTEAMATKEP